MLLSDGISKVRAFALPMGVGSGGQANQLTGAAVVKWQSSYSDMLYQIYVNGRLAGVTIEPAQRQIIVPLPLSQKTAVRIEIFAIDFQNANTDFSGAIDSKQVQSGRVKIEFPKADDLPVDGGVDYYLGDESLNKRTIKMLPEYSDKSGFGLSSFGRSDFGYDGSASLGFTRGNFGFGWFGFDTDMLCWQSRQLETGNYKFNIKITDKQSNEQIIETETMTVIALAKPASEVKVKSFDKQNGKLIIETA